MNPQERLNTGWSHGHTLRDCEWLWFVLCAMQAPFLFQFHTEPLVTVPPLSLHSRSTLNHWWLLMWELQVFFCCFCLWATPGSDQADSCVCTQELLLAGSGSPKCCRDQIWCGLYMASAPGCGSSPRGLQVFLQLF